MSGTYAQARMNRKGSPDPRKALKAPDHPIAIRQEYIATARTTLIVTPQRDAESSAAYTIQDEDGWTQFTASGWKFNGRGCREFRDASGLPLFELHKNSMSLNNAWFVTLPGRNHSADDLAVGSLRLKFRTAYSGNFNITFTNVAALDTKQESGRERMLEVERYGNVIQSFDVVDGDRKVAEVRESIQYNKKLALRASSRRHGYQPVLEVIITPGVDMSLVATIAVIASDSVFGND